MLRSDWYLSVLCWAGSSSPAYKALEAPPKPSSPTKPDSPPQGEQPQPCHLESVIWMRGRGQGADFRAGGQEQGRGSS